MADEKPSYSVLLHYLKIQLSSTNYIVWKRQIRHVLTPHGLFGYVDGSKPCPMVPSEPVEASFSANSSKTFETAKSEYDQALSARNAWVEEDQRICSLLFASLSEEVLNEIPDYNTSNELWEAIAAIYENRSKSTILRLRHQAYNLRRTGSVHDLSLQFKSIFDQLSLMGSPVTNEDQLLWFLNALGPEYQSFSAPLINLSPTPMYIDVVAQAKNHEAFMTNMQGKFGTRDTAGGQAAFLATGVPSGGGAWNHASTVAARGGRMWGSRAIRGRNSGGRGRSGQRSSSSGDSGASGSTVGTNFGRVTCNFYHKVGHSAQTCYRLFPHLRRTETANLTHQFQNSLQIEPSSVASDWYIDSGATSYLTSNASVLEKCDPLSRTR